jgi:hypothetical protein
LRHLPTSNNIGAATVSDGALTDSIGGFQATSRRRV